MLPRLEARIAATYTCGDAFAWADPLSQGLAAIQAAYHGAPYSVDPDTLTGWAGTLFEVASTPNLFLMLKFPGGRPRCGCWMPAPGWGENAGAPRSRIYRAAEKSWRFLRGSELLALDLVDRADEIGLAVVEINAAWWYYFQECYAAIHRWQPGYIDWLGIWSDAPAATVECDYMVMVSPRMFEGFFLPGVAEQVEMVERSLFHLDGPGAVKHLDMLLALPRLRGMPVGADAGASAPGGLAADVPADPGGG